MVSPVRAARATAHRLGSAAELPGLALSVGALLLALLCAALGLEIGALALLAVSVVGELLLDARAPKASLLLRQASFGVPMRFVLRAFVGLLATEHLDSIASARWFVVAAVFLTIVLCGRSLHEEYRLLGPLKPMQTRNVPGSPHIDEVPPRRTEAVVVAQALVLVPALVGAQWWLGLALGIVGVAVVVAVTLPDVRDSWSMRQAKRATGYTGPLRAVQDFLDQHRPEVVVHISGPEAAGYQINTWIETLEALERRVVVVVRDPPLFGKVATTTIPIVDLRDPGELLMLDFSAAKVALYPANTGNNIHLLRLPGLMSAFIGHGDSDKSASNNPFSRVYDELWVAGEAGADRYRRSGLNIHEDQYRLVGRPQVHGIGRTPLLGDDPVPTVLYAPTWEGVNLEQEYSSVSAVGPQVVQALLASDPPVRVVYKPHPFMGQRDAKYRDVHARIVAMIKAAKTTSGIDHRVVRGGSINEWFNQATAIVTDISSVVSDFLASEKPYAVFNHTPLDVAEFRLTFPSTAAGTVIGRDGSGIADFVAVVTRAAPDEHAAARATLATYLLGRPEQRTLASFNAAVDALVARCESERAGYR